MPFVSYASAAACAFRKFVLPSLRPRVELAEWMAEWYVGDEPRGSGFVMTMYWTGCSMHASVAAFRALSIQRRA